MNFLLKATGLRDKGGGASKAAVADAGTNAYCTAPDVRFPIIAGQSVPNSADVGGVCIST